MPQAELKVLASRHGYCEDHSVAGIWYQNNSGEKGWHVTVPPEDDCKPQDYWVSANGEFHAITLHFWPDLRTENAIKLSTTIKEPTPQEKKAIRAALGAWKQE
jgi:hypothetical protein